MSGLKCDVCDGVAVSVSASSLGAISYAYCIDCAVEGAEPYSATVGTVAMLGGKDSVDEWFMPVVNATCKRSNKTLDQFWQDVSEFMAKDDYDGRC